MGKLRRWGWVAAAAALTGCSPSSPATTAADAGATQPVPAVVTTTTAAAQPRVALRRLAEPFDLGDVRVTLLSVEDPFASTPGVQPAPGNRLLLLKYEMISLSPDALDLSDLPSVDVRDTTGATFRSEHGRLSMAAGARTPGQLPAGKRMEASAVFEVPASATGLRAAFRAGPQPEEVVMIPLE